MTPPVRKRLDRRSGQMVIFMTTSLFVLFSAMGLSVDLGYSYFKKIQAQGAADAAATAAMVYAKNNGYACGTNITCNSSYSCPASPATPATTALQAGCLYAKANGFVNTGHQSVSLIANSTTVETGNSTALWIRANVSETVPHVFLFWSGFHSGSVAAQAISGLTTKTTGSSGSSIYALTTFSDSGSGNVTATGISVGTNFSDTASGNINATINIVGNFTDNASGNITGTVTYGGTKSGSRNSSPGAVKGTVAPVVDPLASAPAPSVASPPTCDHTNYTYSSSSNASVSPGVYCGGMTISGSGTLTFGTGTYILYGGGMTYNGSGNLSGSNVMFYNTGATTGSTDKIAAINLTGSGNMNLSAPSSGGDEGILFFQDRTQTYATANKIEGSGNVSTGTFYFPTTEVDYSGSGTAHYQAIVANVVVMAGSGNLPADTTGTYTGLVTTSVTASLIQ